MESLETRRKQTIWNISLNPVTINIKRTEKIEADGGFTESESQLGPYIVRIFKQKNSNQKEMSTLAGTKEVDDSWGMLADYTVDLKAGPNVKDEFDVAGLGHFLIKATNPQLVEGQIAGYQADLEKVD
jgi:hypothetical protein